MQSGQIRGFGQISRWSNDAAQSEAGCPRQGQVEVIWFCAALEAMKSVRNVAHNLKGWDISEMSKAFLSEHNAQDSVEYLKAEEMAADGTLFANITGKSKGGDNADAIMLEGKLTLTLILA